MSKLRLFIIFLLFTPFSFANNQESCKVSGYIVGFFNGIQTTRSEAHFALSKLKSNIGKSSYSGEKVDYQLFYNDSRYDEKGKYLLADFVETFDQRTQELDQQVNNKWEAFWEIINGRQNSSIIQRIGAIFTGFLDLVKELVNRDFNFLIKKFLQSLAASVGSVTPNAAEVLTRHKLIGDSLAWKGKKMIYIAHSQGNLWVNKAYQHTLSQEGYRSDNVKVIHIAPASPIINGDYILSSSDFVINGLQLTGIGSVKKPNVLLPISSNDYAGHGLIEIYLKHPKTKEMIKRSVNKAFGELKKPDMEDFAYQIEFSYDKNFSSIHEDSVFGWLSSNKKREYNGDEDFADYNGLIPDSSAYAFSTVKEENDNQKKTYTLTTCDGFTDKGSYLAGVFSKNTELDSDKNVTYRTKISDRYGKVALDKSYDINPDSNDMVECMGAGTLFELTGLQDFYSDKQKVELKKLRMKGTYWLESNLIDQICLPH
ncbi:conserved exported hypothetical protein [Vibrio nigripulchritudo POn4]|uniref:hypothetical protein n=1 Tax=Vibrio nigripulchritudo TaxID=28173 RepID=UPI0003B1C716|nr:hypothetical protein [Vibrio nigripulchritudo]CCN67268.1 conserved exported hypothetical protein [Vibrio nigripulchritudo POn4]